MKPINALPALIICFFIFHDAVAQPVAGFSYSKDTSCFPVTVSFSDSSSGAIASWKWNLGDGNSSASQNPQHVYPQPDKYSPTLIVTDSAGLKDTVTKTVEVGLWIKNIQSTAASCYDSCDGTATVTPEGGVPPYTYNWSNNQMDSVATGLCAGQNTVTITDDSGCVVIDSVTVTEPDSLSVSINYQEPSSPGACDGEATASVSGGVPPYMYQWSQGPTTPQVNGLCDGQYDLTVIDNNACTWVDSVTLNEPSISLSFNSQDVSCYGANDGQATVTPTGGTSPYTYNWSQGSSGQQIDNLGPGTYTVTVADDSGYTASGSVSINEPDSISKSFTTQHVSCYGACDGEATATVTGGTAPYQYSWMNGDTGSTVDLCAGQYYVTITDDSGCVAVDSVTINQPDSLTLTIDSVKSPICSGTNNGYISASVTGGTQPFLYLWSNGDSTSGTTTTSFSALSPWSYKITVTDSNGCTAVDSANITADSTCVWPGDANSDGVADNNDILAIGVAHGTSGPVRSNASLSWNGQPASDWADTLSGGTNYKHSDCDGDGLIDHADTLAVDQNYGLTHSKTSQSGSPADPPLYVDLPDTVQTADTVYAPIKFGSMANPVSGAYGVAFSIDYDSSDLEGLLSVSYSNSWMGTSGSNLLGFSHDLPQKERTDVTITRTDQVNLQQNYGQIGKAKMVIKDDVSGKVAPKLNISITNVRAINVAQEELQVNGQTRQAVKQPVSIDKKPVDQKIEVYPNPARETLYLAYKNKNAILENIRIYSINGTLLKTFPIQGRQSERTIDIHSLTQGMYFYRVELSNGKRARGKFVKK